MFPKSQVLIFLCLLLGFSAAFPTNFTEETVEADVDLNRARYLIKYSSISYCPEAKVLAWDCLYCKEADFSSFIPKKFIKGAFDTEGYIGVNTGKKEILIVMQGSSSIANWIANLQFFKLDYNYPGLTGAQVHSGFYKSSSALYEDLKPTLESLLKQYVGFKVVVTGHSQGGATGIMVALMIRDYLGVIPEVQTFGEPRVGNQVYANYWKSRISQTLRFTHKRDPVPQLPPASFGFHHHPTEVWLQDGHGTSYKVCDSTGEDPTCHNSVALPVAVMDHLWYLDIPISECK